MPPQAKALLTPAALHGPPRQSSAFPPQRQGFTDRHGSGPEDCEEAGQLLQCHHVQQQTHSPLRAGPPQGECLGANGWLEEMDPIGKKIA